MKVTVELPVEVVKKEKWYVASCPALDVHSQGATEEEARRNLGEALSVFFESCLERGTLDEVLKSRGFAPASLEAGDYEALPSRDRIDVPIYLLSKFSDDMRCHA